MGQSIELTGMVLNAMPIGDYDKRITILTRERGKITAFARGARRPNSQLLAASNPFCFGKFELFEGRSSYNLTKATIQNYFFELATDYDAACIGFYFLEFADYFCQENNDELQMLKLLYQSLRALEREALSNELVRVIFELKAMAINGEGPNVFSCMNCHSKEALLAFSVKRGGVLCKSCSNETGSRRILESTSYTLQYILSSPIEKLYTFMVSQEVLQELKQIMKEYLSFYLRHEFKSLKIICEEV